MPRKLMTYSIWLANADSYRDAPLLHVTSIVTIVAFISVTTFFIKILPFH